MSATTPDWVVRSIWNNARGIGEGPVVSQADWRRYVSDLDGWFMYLGDSVSMSAKSIGGGMYQIKGKLR